MTIEAKDEWEKNNDIKKLEDCSNKHIAFYEYINQLLTDKMWSSILKPSK